MARCGVVVLFVALLVSCRGDDSSDAGRDAGALDVGGTDGSGADAGPLDGGTDVVVDAAVDAAVDAGVDADTRTDAGVDAGSRAPCTSVAELRTPNGLTPEQRQTRGRVTGPLLPPGPFYSLLEYTTIFGVAADTYPSAEPDPSGFGFPGINRNRLTFYMEQGKYISQAFRAPTGPSWDGVTGSFFYIPDATFVSATIAPCPGQFADDAAYPLSPSCRVFGEDSIRWRVGGAGAGCNLEPGATYYLNVINAALDDPTTSTCLADECTFKILESNTPPGG